ncbi:MAG: DUF86 domain-containing protein [Anaerolineae bacterium]|jgi:uncharacterized protein with HEPN domain|nr:DUF86 domain-containing protein [Anaerolineae bacterium]
MNLHDKTRLQDMLKEAIQTQIFIEGKTKDDLTTNTLLVYGLVRAIEIIGEAANVVSKDLQHQLTDIDWVGIIGMRHRLIHHYQNVDLDIIWDVVSVDIPKLIHHLKQILED